jgi:hypothetical protein
MCFAPRFGRVTAVAAFCVLTVLSAYACGGPAGGTAGSPTAVLQQFLTAMDQSATDDRALRVAYDLLASSAQSALEQRSERAKALAGQPFEPWQMLAQGRFRLRFSPAARRGMRETISGDRATVVVAGTNQGERADVQLVRENGAWKLKLEL